MEIGKKYHYLHRIHVLAIMYILISLTSKILKTPDLIFLFIPALIYYLIFPKTLDSIFQFRKRFYRITFAIAGGIIIPGAGNAGINTTFSIFEYIGTVSTLLLLFILFNSFFILMKAFKLEPKNLLKDEKEPREVRHDP